MVIINILHDEITKTAQKRTTISECIRSGNFTVEDLFVTELTEKDAAIILEAMEEVSRNEPFLSNVAWLEFAEKYIESANTLKREASRVVGNIAPLYADRLDGVISKLIVNSTNDGTVVRWGSGYALGRIITIPEYAKSNLFERLTLIAETEQESGVKNQYLSGLKKAKRIRCDT